jgi:hypothetical protein
LLLVYVIILIVTRKTVLQACRRSVVCLLMLVTAWSAERLDVPWQTA